MSPGALAVTLSLLAPLACDRNTDLPDNAAALPAALSTPTSKAWLVLKAKPDLAPSRRLHPHLRGPWVNDTLKTFAEATSMVVQMHLDHAKMIRDGLK